MQRPAVSIIIPCFQAARFLEEALDSALSQTRPAEVIAVDDGSTDATGAILTRYAAQHGSSLSVVTREHGGVSAARNAGVAASSGTYLLFLDADDVLRPRAVEVLHESVSVRDACAAIGDWQCFVKDGPDRRVQGRLHYPKDAYASCVRMLTVLPAVLLRRSEVRWNEGRAVWEGLEYMLQALAPCAGIPYVDEVVVDVRQHDSPERFSTRHDHFEPALTGAFFAEQKAYLRQQQRLTAAREEALDQRIIDNACALVRSSRSEQAVALLEAVSWERVGSYDWFRIRSFAGLTRFLGPRLGSAVFHRVNRALGRL
jgi:glycosyltransferase involved in cell wall biosynthesis